MDDVAIRVAAFAELDRRVKIHGPTLSWDDLIPTFRIGKEEIYLTNRARGIFKPRQMKRGVLSLKSTIPRIGRLRRYVDDHRGESLVYSFQGDDPNAHDNQRLKEAFEDKSAFIYFAGVSSGRYEAFWPAYVTKWLPRELKVEIEIGESVSIGTSSTFVREEPKRYRTALVQQRLHQSAFREMVLDAYDGRCALSGLPVRRLLTAAHLYPDGHEKGIASVTNGIALSALHHLAYDSKLIGISPDGRIDISEGIYSQTDGPLLEDGLKGLRGSFMRFPLQDDLRPDRDALAYRYEEYLAAR